MNGPRSPGRFTVPAAVAVQNARVGADAAAGGTASALRREASLTRIGIMMSRGGGTEDQALARLRALSQNEHHSWWLLLARSSTTPSAALRPAATAADLGSGKPGL